MYNEGELGNILRHYRQNVRDDECQPDGEGRHRCGA